MASNINVIYVLILKSFLLRKQHKLLTAIEFLWPIVLIIVGKFAMNLNSPSHHHPTEHHEAHSEEQLENSIQDINLTIYYTPQNNVSKMLMNNVNNMLPTAYIVGVDEEQEAKQALFGNPGNKFIIVFRESANIERFKYEIRPVREHWSTYSAFIKHLDKANSSYDPIIFMTLQHCIEKTFLKLVNVYSNKSIEIQMHAFPLPAFVHNVNAHETVKYVVTPIVLTAVTINCSTLVIGILIQKKREIKAFMKIYGVRRWLHWFGWIFHAFPLYLVYIITLIFILKLPIWSNASLFPESDLSLMIFFFVLYSAAELSFFFAITNFCSKPTIAVPVALVIWIIPYLWFEKLTSAEIYECLFVSVLLKRGCRLFATFEEFGVGLHWTTLVDHPTGEIVMRNVLIMCFVDILLYSAIGWYAENINPGPYIVSKTLLPGKCIKNKKMNQIELNAIETIHGSEPEDSVPLIKICSLYKKYGSKIAIENFSINIYKDEITVILGHVGSGKSTLVRLLTGMIVPTSGTIIFNGSTTEEFRSNIGIVLPNQVLFKNLTVKENLTLFGMLKNLSRTETRNIISHLCKQFKLLKIENLKINNLHENMQTRVLLINALIGNPKILILDNLTFKMDINERREVWDILVDIRKGRTILMTTCCVDEAVVLADRIGILNNGQLESYGPHHFLENLYGVGYVLAINKKYSNASEIVSKIIEQCVGETRLYSENDVTTCYMLSNNKLAHLPELLKLLEQNKEHLGISSLDIIDNSLEEIFGNMVTKKEKQESQTSLNINCKSAPKVDISSMLICETESKEDLKWKKVFALVWKRFIFTVRKWGFFLPITILGTTLMILSSVSRRVYTSNDVSFTMNLDLYGPTKILFDYKGREADKITGIYCNLDPNSECIKTPYKKGPYEAGLHLGEHNSIMYLSKYIVGAKISSNSSEIKISAFYSTHAFHAASISVNLINNALLKTYKGSNCSITVINKPIHWELEKPNEKMKKYIFFCVLRPIGAFILISMTLFYPLYEQKNHAKQLQQSAGVDFVTYWSSCYLWDMVYHTIISHFISLLYIFLLPNQPQAVLSIFLILFCHGLSGIPHTYIFSLFPKKGPYFYFIINIFLGIVLPVMMYMLRWKSVIIGKLCLIIPQYTTTLLFINFFLRVENFRLCKHSMTDEVCDTFKKYFVKFFPFGYLLTVLLVDVIIYVLLLFILEYKIFNLLCQDTFRIKYVTKISDDVEDERKRVLEQINSEHYNDLLIVNNLQKRFTDVVALRSLTFGISAGSCVGLLGKSGSGKSVAMKILIGLIKPTDGDVIIKGISHVYNKKQAISQIGYCPQSDDFSEFLNAKEQLWLFAQFRGVSPKRVSYEVDEWIHSLDLEECCKELSGKYSYKDKRKLSMALALIGNPTVILLDEPTERLDYESKQRLWEVINKIKNTPRCVIFATRCIHQCELFCNSLATIDEGQLVSIGKMEYLRERYTRQYNIKIYYTAQTPETTLSQIKHCVISTFQCDPKISLRGTLHYQVTESNIKLHTLFTKMEEVKKVFPEFIVQYRIYKTTMEQMFLSLVTKDTFNSDIDEPLFAIQ